MRYYLKKADLSAHIEAPWEKMMPELKKKLHIPILLIIGLAAVMSVVYLFLQKNDGIQTPGQPYMDHTKQDRYPGAADNQNQVDAYLYFASADGSFLSSEKRNIFHSGDSVDFGKRIVQELIDGPHGKLHRTIPEQTSLRAFYISNEGIAYVDFSQEIRELYPGGSHSEYLTIYSIVNSIVYNVPDVKAVKFLVNGNDATTLAGHIGIGLPIRANMVMVR